MAIYVFYDRGAPQKNTTKYPLSHNLSIFIPLAWFIVGVELVNELIKRLSTRRINLVSSSFANWVIITT